MEAAGDGEAAIAAFDSARPDLVLLDLMLPRIDGLEVFRRIRSRGADRTAVIMLTAKTEEADRVVGLELGADDYVTKPFSPREVVARVKAVLRRARAGLEPLDGELLFGDLRIDGRRREARLRDRIVKLTPKEFDLLYLMASNPGRVFTRLELLEELWDFAFDGDPATVTVHLRRLRQKVEDDPSRPQRLVTVWGVGYRFEP